MTDNNSDAGEILARTMKLYRVAVAKLDAGLELTEEERKAVDACSNIEGPSKKDRRRETSARNLPDNEPIDWGEVAEQYQQEQGKVLCRPEGLYEFNGMAYSPISETDLSNSVTDFLKAGKALYRSGNKERPIKFNTNNRANLCAALHGCNGYGLVPPVYISTRESAVYDIVLGNGILDARTAGQYLAAGATPGRNVLNEQHSDNLFATRWLPYEWDPECKCPKWIELVETLLPDQESREMLQMLFGYCLVPVNNLQSFWFLHGEPGTGRSTVLKVLEALLTGGRVDLEGTKVEGNDENVDHIPLPEWADRFRVGKLTRILVNIVGDLPTTEKGWTGWEKLEGLFLDATGGGGRIAHQRKFDATIKTLPVIARQVWAGNTLAAWMVKQPQVLARLRLIHFPNVIRGTEKDNPKLGAEIATEELEGVFVWAVKGLGMLLKHEGQFPQSASGKCEIEKARWKLDPEHNATEFAKANCRPDPAGFINAAELHAEYREAVEELGFMPAQFGTFKRIVCETFAGVEIGRDRSGKQRGFRGLRRATPPPPPPPRPPSTIGHE